MWHEVHPCLSSCCLQNPCLGLDSLYAWGLWVRSELRVRVLTEQGPLSGLLAMNRVCLLPLEATDFPSRLPVPVCGVPMLCAHPPSNPSTPNTSCIPATPREGSASVHRVNGLGLLTTREVTSTWASSRAPPMGFGLCQGNRKECGSPVLVAQ